MNILYVNKMYAPDVGGVETVVKQYAEYMGSLGNEVTVLCSSKKWKYRTKIEQINGVKVVRCASLGSFFSMPISLSLVVWFLWLRRKADVIHFHEPFPIGTLLGCFPFLGCKKMIVTWHSDIFKQKFIKKPVEYFQQKLLKKAEVITTTSENLKQSSSLLLSWGHKIKVIPLSIDVDCFKRDSDASPANIDGRIKGKYALFIGRLSYYKGIGFLLNSLSTLSKMAKVGKVTVVVAGEGDSSIRTQLLNFVNNEHVELIFIDRFVTEAEKQTLLKNAYAFLFPSIYPSEAFGIMQLEALACGVPVINTYLPTGVPWVSLHEKTGLTVDVLDEQGLAEAIVRMFKEEAMQVIYANNAVERVQTLFSDKVVLKSVQALYVKD